MKKLDSWYKVKKGQKFKVVSNSNSHNYPMNVLLTFKHDLSKVNSGTQLTQLSNVSVEHNIGNTLDIRDVDFMDWNGLTLSDLQDELRILKEEYETKVDLLNTQIEYLQETGSKGFDDEEYKIYNILKELKKNSSDLEKTQAIKKLLNN